MKLYIMRHGRTDWNNEFRIQGQTDTELNEEGIQMALDAGEKYRFLHFDVCYCSPLCRARETARLFLQGTDTPIIIDGRLSEMRFGQYEGMSHVFQHPESPINKFFTDPEHFVADCGAESLEELFARTRSFLQEVIEPQRETDKTILIVGHGALNRCIISQYKNISLNEFWNISQQNCELTQLI